MANGETNTVDYDALANQYGQINPNIDYDALARQHGAISSTAPPSTPAAPPSVVYQRSPGTAGAQISAQPSTFENWLQNVGADIRYGGARTGIGRVLSALLLLKRLSVELGFRLWEQERLAKRKAESSRREHFLAVLVRQAAKP